jgi:hypothetical protein
MTREPIRITRDELHRLVWSKTMRKVAEELGTSYVELVKACTAMGVPRPTSGQWKNLMLGQTVEQVPLPEAQTGVAVEFLLKPKGTVSEEELPPLPEDPPAEEAEVAKAETGAQIVETSVERDGAEQAADVRPVGKRPEPGRLELPPEGVELHPVAEGHVQALQKAKPGELGFVSIRGRDLFWCDMTPALAPRFGRAVHAFVCELEHRGYSFEEAEDDGEGLGIVRDGDRVEVRWSEGKIDLEREPTNVDKRRPSWTWSLKETKATGELAVEVNASGLKGKRKWKEGDGRSLEGILGVVVEKVEATFRWLGEQRKRKAELAWQEEEAEKRRVEEATREAERQAKLEEERKARERVRRHEAKLEQILELRRQNLLVAAKLWIQSRGVAAYVAYCEATWRITAGGALTQAQADWLAWAKGEAARMGPFGKGYPVPERDGKLDVSTVPVGGPYPEPTELEELEEVEPERPAAEPEVRYVDVPRQPEQFPFWLLHRKH